jgi:hypothetical protein
MRNHYIFIFIVLFIVSGAYVSTRPLFYTPKDKVRILMCGRSTMGLWFKHWNWPYPLRIKTTYKPWPIPYKIFANNKLYLKYCELSGPRSKDKGVPFGESMIKSFEDGLKLDKYSGAFFKFCYVDYPVNSSKEKEERLSDLKNVITRVHSITHARGMKLVVGNAMPLMKPTSDTVQLQNEFNKWLIEFTKDKKDMMILDMYKPFVDKDGKLRREMARSEDDTHLGEKAFQLLDKSFFTEIQNWLIT